LPRQLHTDQGRNFESKLLRELCVIAGITKTKTTPLHPRSDGQAERLNRSLLQMLRTAASQHVHNWPNYLPTLMSAYRMTVHSVTGVTPNETMLGPEVLTPATRIAQPPNETHKLTVPNVTSYRNSIREAHTGNRKSPVLTYFHFPSIFNLENQTNHKSTFIKIKKKKHFPFPIHFPNMIQHLYNLNKITLPFQP